MYNIIARYSIQHSGILQFSVYNTVFKIITHITGIKLSQK